MLRLKTLVILMFATLAALFLTTAWGADYREEFSKTLPLKAGDTFALENVNGNVVISTWKNATVEIKAVKVARDDEKDLKDVEIKVEESAGKVSVRAIWPKRRTHFNVHVDFDIKVPEGVNLEAIETVNGGIEAAGMFGSGEVETTNGTIRVESVKGNLKASTTNGDIRVSRLDGKLEAETVNGGIKLEEVAFKDGLSAETTNGSITLALVSPETVNATLDAETTNGHVSVDFPVTIKNLRQSRKRIEAQIGQGGPVITLRTTNGSITITK
jgi:DUF4097 and DUF4098 domain-containing protein YvlB